MRGYKRAIAESKKVKPQKHAVYLWGSSKEILKLLAKYNMKMGKCQTEKEVMIPE